MKAPSHLPRRRTPETFNGPIGFVYFFDEETTLLLNPSATHAERTSTTVERTVPWYLAIHLAILKNCPAADVQTVLENLRNRFSDGLRLRLGKVKVYNGDFLLRDVDLAIPRIPNPEKARAQREQWEQFEIEATRFFPEACSDPAWLKPTALRLQGGRAPWHRRILLAIDERSFNYKRIRERYWHRTKVSRIELAQLDSQGRIEHLYKV